MSKTVDVADLSASIDKKPTAIHQQFSDWLIDKTGFDPSETTPEEAWMQAIKLGALHRGDFQRSPENREARDERARLRKEETQIRALEREEKAARVAAENAERAAKKAAKAEAGDEPKAAAKPKTVAKPRKRAAKAESAEPVEAADDNVKPIRKSRKSSGARPKSASAPSPF